MLSTFFCSDHKTGRDCRRSSTPMSSGSVSVRTPWHYDIRSPFPCWESTVFVLSEISRPYARLKIIFCFSGGHFETIPNNGGGSAICGNLKFFEGQKVIGSKIVTPTIFLPARAKKHEA